MRQILLLPGMDATSEQICIARIRTGDSAAFTPIVDAYKHMAYTIAMRILKNEADAEDVSQEAFIKAYQQIHQFQGKSKFSTWLYTIVYRTALAKSKEHSIQTMTLSSSNENHEDGGVSPMAQVEAEEEQRQVKAAVERLGKTDALLVTLYYSNENTVGEIAQITGLSIPNIKIRLHRSRKKLERDLQTLIQPSSRAANG